MAYFVPMGGVSLPEIDGLLVDRVALGEMRNVLAGLKFSERVLSVAPERLLPVAGKEQAVV